MNSHVHITTAASGAILDDLYGDACELVHELHFLICDLEHGLSSQRGEVYGDGGVRLSFQMTSIDATLWLAGDAWNKASCLRDRIEKIQSTAVVESGRAA